jgi:hypothetical protein
MLGAVAGNETRWNGRLQSKRNASTSSLCAAILSVSIFFALASLRVFDVTVYRSRLFSADSVLIVS